MTDKIRLGRYLQTALIIGDLAIITLAYILSYTIFDVSPEFKSKWVWLAVNVAFLPSAFAFSDIHRMRILYADRVVLQAFKSTVVYGATIVSLFYVLGISDVGWKSGFV